MHPIEVTGICMFKVTLSPLIGLLYCKLYSNTHINLPEVLGCKHFIVVYKLALMTGNLQRGKNIIHPREASAGTGQRTMHFPLENVKAGPTSHVRSLEGKEHSQVITRHLMK